MTLKPNIKPVNKKLTKKEKDLLFWQYTVYYYQIQYNDKHNLPKIQHIKKKKGKQSINHSTTASMCTNYKRSQFFL